MLVLDPSPREAEPFTRITRRCRAVRSLPLAPSSVPLIPSRQCAAFIEKSELTTGGSLPLCLGRESLITFSTSCSLLLAPCSLLPAPCSLLPAPCSLLPAPRSNHVLNRPGLGIRSPLDVDEPSVPG
jgi:hypothetical protein